MTTTHSVNTSTVELTSSHGSMKTFYRKEWRDNWQSFLWIPALTAVLLGACALYNLSVPESRIEDRIDAGTTEGALAFLWTMAAALTGSSLVAPEIGGGTLQFLSALPISRRRMWTGKLVVGFLSMLLCITLSGAVYVAVYVVALNHGLFSYPLALIRTDTLKVAPILLLIDVAIFSISMLMTMLVDRTINAVIGTIIVAAIAGSVFSSVPRYVLSDGNACDIVQWALVGLTIPICLSMSYTTFLRGETLKTSKRFRVAVPGLLIDLAIIVVTLIVAFIWILS